MEAYDEYLLGRKHAHDRIPGWHAKAREAFRRALELDPNYAPAHAGLAYALFVMAPDLTEESFEAAVASAERSIELDPNLAEGIAILGLLQAFQGPKQIEEGIANLRRALELDPSFSDTYNWLSMQLSRTGQYDEARRVMAQGHAVDPLLPSLTSNFANQLSNSGDIERALRILERHTRLPELTNPIRGALVDINFEWGRYADALPWMEDFPHAARALEALGLREEADSRLAEVRPDDQELLFGLVLPSLHSRGQHDQARATLVDRGLDPASLGRTARTWLLITPVKAGVYGEAIDLFETFFDGNPATVAEASWVIAGQSALNALAFAYQQTGDVAKAAELLAYRDDRITHLEPLASPYFLEPMALNAALSGDVDEAYELLARAVDLGWANYYMTINDPRWGDTLNEPRFVELMERVQQNLAQQRTRVETMLRDSR